MTILVTGATGLVGAHSALALMRAGHKVRLLVRDKHRARSWFAQQGVADIHYIQGDMRDHILLEKAMQDCDAVLHAAAVVDLNASRAEQTLQANLAGLEAVVTQAVGLRIPKILYVSSLAVLMRPGVFCLRENGPMAVAHDAYSRAKLACEQRVRDLQESGAPIVISYPAAVVGPDDPKLSESNAALRLFIEQFLPLTSSGLQIVDARDLGEFHRRMLEARLDQSTVGGNAERYIVGGHFVAWRELNAQLKQLGTRPLALPVPGWLLRILGGVMDALRVFIPVEFPLSRESARMATQFVPADSSRLLHRYGEGFRPLSETLADTVSWLAESAQLSKKCSPEINNNTVELKNGR
ncbi:SDR family NAD(P)-dependent oxidoreductase [Spongiibacter sp. KMU-158]|uniref:SDR family NAD(P)-dependent oxidoreductase n=1 Tax=Spongiibacter pelagi TaxID=2760804 RepID=A0A927GVY1_9GAMM|nr:SDR family NAD(P)-dependent oxidoreductase [Spongiibacter pelagi]MBD2857854.1 SDR family NAD(P)-dependent oxidoreductase [Spongiibacter pelagi]